MSLARELARRMVGTTKGKPQTREVRADFGPPAEFTGPTSQAWKDHEAKLSLPPVVLEAPPPPPPVLRPGWRGNCKAVSAATGRRCCLLEGHEAAHRHGSTAFVTVALTDDDVARARARMDAIATARRFDPSPHETP